MSDDRVTRLLADIRQGDAGASEELAALLYEKLRGMARREMAVERPEHTLQPTALVHEAYLRLASGDGAHFNSRAHFLGAAAIAIRRVLAEHARRRGRLKRGGGYARLDLDALDPTGPVKDEALIELDEALVRLAGFAPGLARIVELRFFAGMTFPETAKLLEISESTVKRDWRLARAWLRRELEGQDGA